MNNQNDLVLDIFVNPLSFTALDTLSQSNTSSSINTQMILDWLCLPESKPDLESVIDRYNEINVLSNRLYIAPAEKNILEKLIWPLKNAKGSYMIGNYLGTIALCGMVAEMVAILNFEISNPAIQISGKPIDNKTQEKIFGRNFEQLGQERRVEILLAYGIINDVQKQRFNDIKGIRNRYLHFYSKEHTNIVKDAVTAFEAAVSLVTDLLEINIVVGKISINPALARYLIEKGFAQIPPTAT